MRLPVVAGIAGAPDLLSRPGGQSWQLGRAPKTALDQLLRAAVAADDVPGVVVLVTTRDSILYHEAFGVMDPVANRAMIPNAMFDIASMTKPVTSLGIMMLVEEGKLELDDHASRYVPELLGREVLVSIDSANGTVVTRPASREITIRDLLRHTSGFGYTFSHHGLHALARHTRIPVRQWPLVHDPGTRWTYGMSTAHLGWIIENLTGMPLLEFFERRIFGPLEMAETSFSVPSEKLSRLMTTFQRQDGRLVATTRPDSIQAIGAGDGDLISTATDFAKFVQLMLGRGEWGGKRLVREASIAEMARNQLGDLTVVEQPGANPSLSAPFPPGAGRDGFGLGFQLAVSGPDGRPDGTLSWAGLYNTHFWIDATNGIGVLFMTQVLPFHDRRVIEVLGAVERTIYRPGDQSRST